MEQKIIKLLDSNLECTDCRIKDKKIIMDIQSIKKQLECPFCKVSSYPMNNPPSTTLREP